MAEVHFYVLPSQSLTERYGFACKLIEKTYRMGQYCYVLTDSIEQSQRLDDLLWTFRAGSFIPHQLAEQSNFSSYQKVLIGSSLAPKDWQSYIINVSSQTVTQPAEQILEILDNSEATKSAGRMRYRYYQQCDYSLFTHKLQPDGSWQNSSLIKT